MARNVHLSITSAPLLSGSLDSCLGPGDPTCQGGVAGAAAFARAYSQGAPLLFLAFLDKETAFVHMCQQGWSVNRVVLQYLLGLKAFLSSPSVLLQNKGDFEVSNRDISALQSQELPLLLSNVAVPLGNSWNQYTVPILFNTETRLAVMSIVDSDQRFNIPQLDAAIGGLDYIARVNEQSGCDGDYVDPISAYLNMTNTTTTANSDSVCWISVIFYRDVPGNFDPFFAGILKHENPPGLLIYMEENALPFAKPRRVGTANKTWFINAGWSPDDYQHQVITLTEDLKSIETIEFIALPLDFSYPAAPPDARDAAYNNTITALAELTKEARLNDPIVVYSEEVPVHKVDTYRRCEAGECEIGSLFLDAQRWWTGMDFAFGNSGGFRGSGWPAGPVRISNLWDSLPFPNNLCTGVMSGVSVFKMFNFSTALATFTDQNTPTGDLLLQISGMRMNYNTNLTGSRLISIDMFDRNTSQYLPLERLKLYSFATDSYMCSGHDIYKHFSNEDLVFPGEEKGVIDQTVTQQEVTAEYLLSFNGTVYKPSSTDRMFNNISDTHVLNLVQSEDTCTKDEFWNQDHFTCVACPTSSGVVFFKNTLEYSGVQGSIHTFPSQSITLVNTLSHNVTIVSQSWPPWVKITPESGSKNSNRSPRSIIFKNVGPGIEVVLNVEIDVKELQIGTATASVLFGAVDENQFLGCTRPDTSFDVMARIDPPTELNQLGNVRYVGWALSLLVIITSLVLSTWVLRNRNTRIVRTLQPSFLIVISTGVLVMGSSLIPLGLDDQIVSVEACSVACMAFPWLLSIGFTISMTALFSKLWRINKLFNSGLRRVTVTAKDVIAPSVFLFTLDVAAMSTWTIVDPLKWTREEVAGQSWQTYGSCRPEDGTVSLTMALIVAGINLIAFLVACYQAFLARNISDEFSESKSVGVALFSWVQLMMVGIPVIFLIDQNNPSAKYYIYSGLIFAVCMAMLLLIYVPILTQKQKVVQSEFRRSSCNIDFAEHGSVRESSQFSIQNVGSCRVSGLVEIKQAPSVLLKELSPALEEGDNALVLEGVAKLFVSDASLRKLQETMDESLECESDKESDDDAVDPEASGPLQEEGEKGGFDTTVESVRIGFSSNSSLHSNRKLRQSDGESDYDGVSDSSQTQVETVPSFSDVEGALAQLS